MYNKHVIDFVRGTRQYTDEGYLIVPARLARTGIQEYRAFELGLTDRKPLDIIRVYRSPEEVFHPDAVASFDAKPVTDNHPERFVDSDNWRELSRGFARKVQRDGDYLVAELIVTDKALIKLVEAGKVQISNGYTADYDWTPGVTPDGQAYDAQQKNIRGNHVAIVDAARCGPACRVGDNQPPGAKPMAVKKLTIDGIPFELEEAAAAAVEKLVTARDAAVKASVDAAEAMAEKEKEHEKELDAKDKEIEALKKDAITPDQRDALVADWSKMMADAKRLVPSLDTKGKTCDAIRRAVLTEVSKDDKRKVLVDAALAGKKIEDAPADSIKLAFGVIAAAPSVAGKTTSDPVADAFKGAHTDPSKPQLAGRDAYIARMNDHIDQE